MILNDYWKGEINGMQQNTQTGYDSSLVLVSYILAIFTMIVGPLLIWALKKDDDPETAEALRHVANFGISYTIYAFIAWLTTVVLIGFVLGPIVQVAMIVFIVIGIIKTLNGESYRPPFTLDIIK